MEIIVHLPEENNTKDELKKTVARVHMDLIENFINSITCSEEQKHILLKSLYDEFHSL